VSKIPVGTTVAKKPTAKKPTAKKPVAKKPTAKKPVAKKPGVKKPVAKKPGVNAVLARRNALKALIQTGAIEPQCVQLQGEQDRDTSACEEFSFGTDVHMILFDESLDDGKGFRWGVRDRSAACRMLKSCTKSG